jgi:ribose transport system ATP-binding protein
MTDGSATAAEADGPYAVEMRGIGKSFNGVPVLSNVDLALRQGEVHALVGENGAGKSTLMKILQGVYQLDNGTILVDGQPVRLSSTHDAQRAGIGMVFQEFSLVSTMSVSHNIYLGHEPRRFGLIDDRAMVRGARELFAHMGVDIDPKSSLAGYGTAYWQLTEIAKALAQDARILIMDEPTASLAKHETQALFSLIRRLQSQGISIIYISHRMDEIAEIADRVTVLRDGRRIITADIGNLDPAAIIEHIVGRRVSGMEYESRPVKRSGVPLLEARGLRSGAKVHNVSFQLHPGEVLGLAGLMGSGRTELARCLFGVDRLESGEVLVRGRRVSISHPASAIAAGLALIPEDRRLQGLVLQHSVRDNLLLPLLPGLRRGPLIDDSAGSRTVDSLVSKLGIRVGNMARPASLLSGGNQQKVVIAKWIATQPDVLIMDEPTAGVDIGTKSEIISMVREFAAEGKGVILISSELPELLAVSDRVLILRDGSIHRTLERGDIPDEQSLQFAVQGV